MTCPRCQTLARPEQRFCRSCGMELTTDVVQAAARSDPAAVDALASVSAGPPCEICGAPAGGQRRCAECEAPLARDPDDPSPPRGKGPAAKHRRLRRVITILVLLLGAAAALAALTTTQVDARQVPRLDDRAQQYGWDVSRPLGTPEVGGVSIARDRDGAPR